MQRSLKFNSDGTYTYELNTRSSKADGVIAKGVTINPGAQFAFITLARGLLPLGSVFTVIRNNASTPIAGTFSNLSDGSIFIDSNGNTYQADYEGGDGNDLTLTVIL